jgi:hypothetical protein
VLLLGAVACGGGGGARGAGGGVGGTHGPGGGAAGPTAPAAAAMPTVERDHFGPLRSGFQVTLESLRAALPGLAIARDDEEDEGAPVPTFTVSRGTDKLFRVKVADDGTAASALIDSNAVPSSVGVRVGAPFEELRKTAGALDCWTEAGEWDGFVLCKSAAVPNVTYALPAPEGIGGGEGDGEDGGSDEVPPERQRRMVGKSKVETIVWTPR